MPFRLSLALLRPTLFGHAKFAVGGNRAAIAGPGRVIIPFDRRVACSEAELRGGGRAATHPS